MTRTLDAAGAGPGTAAGAAPRAGLPLTSAQQGLAGLELLRPGTAAGITAELVECTHRLDAQVLGRAVAATLAEAEPLRARVDLREATTPVRLDAEPRPEAFRQVVVDRESLVAGVLAELCAEPMDLAAGPLTRAVLVRTPERDRLLLAAHHLVLDGMGAGLFLRRLTRRYDALASGDEGGLPDARMAGAAQIVAEDAAVAASPEAAADRARWREHLAELPPLADSAGADGPVDRVAGAGLVPVRSRRVVPPQVRDAVDALRRELGVGIQTLCLAALGGLADRGPGADAVAVGVPAGRRIGRPRPIGAGTPCTLMTVLPVLVPGGGGIGQVCEAVARWEQRAGSAAGVTQELLLAVDRAEGVARVPSVQVNVLPFTYSAGTGGLAGPVRNLRAGPVADWTLTLRGAWGPGGDVAVEVDVADLPGRDARAEADALVDRALRRLEALARSGTDVCVEDLPRCSVVEETTALWGNSRSLHPVPARTLGQAYRDGVHAHPDQVVLDGDRQLTGAQMWAETSALAGALAARGVGRGDVVGIHLPRGLDQVLAAHALLHLGAVYLPLHIGLPAERCDDMCAQAGARLVVDADELDRLRAAGGDGECPEVPAELDDPAYVLFTSGSTGRPKGVVISHRAIDNRLQWHHAEFGLAPGEGVLYKTPCSFDVHVWELYWPARVGGRMVVAPEGAERDPRVIAELVTGRGVAVLHFVPSMLRALLGSPGAVRALRAHRATGRLRAVVCSGEALARDTAVATHEVTGVWPVNLYGPTEAAVDVTCHRTGPGGPGNAEPAVPLGLPVWNTRLAVLDDAGRILPPGQVGTLWLGGVQLSSGYLGRPDLDAVAFRHDPRFGRVYDSGDLASWGRDGLLRYHGRRDGQVKIRGQRVELGEIEQVLATPVEVSGAVAVVDGERIVAHVAGPDAESALAAARHAARGRLTEAMTPSAWVAHDALPTTTNGKVDRKALAAGGLGAAAVAAAESAESGVAAGSVLLAEVCRVASDALGFAVGPRTDVVAAGADSLACVRLVGQLERALGWAPPVGTVLTSPRPADWVDAERSESDPVFLRLTGGDGDSVDGTAGVTGEAVVLLPPAGGLCWAYLPLVSELAERGQVCALQSPLLDPDAPVFTTLGELCAWQAGVISSRLGEVPVHLVGWSVGGTCAQEIAASGALDVRSVTLLDAYPAEAWQDRPQPGERERTAAVLRMGGVDEAAVDPLPSGREEILAVLAEHDSPLAAMGAVTAGLCLDTVDLTTALLRAHRTRPWDGPAVHVAASASLHDGLDPDRWAPAVGTLERRTVQGAHTSVLTSTAP